MTRRVAFLFAGQGVEVRELALCAETSRQGRELLSGASERAGVDLSRALLRGGRELEATRLYQPTMTALSLGLLRELAAIGSPDACAGHSLGEIAAFCAAGHLAEDAALELVDQRARLMAREAARHPGGMLALRDAGDSEVERALELGRAAGRLDLAAHNAPREWVLSGELTALSVVARSYRTVRLKVEGAWHSFAMAGAVEEFRRELERIPYASASARFVAGGSGDFVDNSREAPALFSEQLTQPVHWTRALRTLVEAGITHFVTVGPGRLLRALLHQTLGPEALALATESPRDLDATLKELSR